jgi:hypothetical protein
MMGSLRSGRNIGWRYRRRAFKKSLKGLMAKVIHAAAKKWVDEQIEYVNTTVTDMTDGGMGGVCLK